MKLKKMEFNVRNVSLYVIACVLIGLGVTLMLRSNLGVSSWDTLHYSLHRLFGITVGTATIVVALIFTVAVIIMNHNFRYLLMAIPIVLVGLLIDFFNLIVLVDLLPEAIWYRILIFTVGLFILPLGGSMLIVSTFPAGVFDEFMFSIMRAFKTSKILLVRVIMELSAVVLALFFCFLADAGLGKFSIGTLIFSITVGYLVKVNLKLFERVGLYEFK
ncbi:MAG: hypothetical protein JXR62_03950 [Bacilli bacterium]|nr:hypothetical protein [Bacilli bacterium]